MDNERLAQFSVVGIPVPQGSKKAYVRGGRAVLVDANDGLKAWRSNVTAAARIARGDGDPFDGYLIASIVFRFVRPRTSKRLRPNVAPDIDKLIRSVFDGITDAGLWVDDARVTTVWADAVYAERPGARVRIGRYIESSEGNDR